MKFRFIFILSILLIVGCLKGEVAKAAIINDHNAPSLVSFTSSLSGTLKVGSSTLIYANFDEDLDPASTITVSLDSGVSLTLYANGGGGNCSVVSSTQLCARYTVSPGERSSDLTVNSIDQANVTDLDTVPNNGTDYSIPYLQNLGDNADIVVISPPLFVSASVNGDLLTMAYNYTLDGSSTPSVSDFIVKKNGIVVSVSNVSISSASVLLTLSTPALFNDVVTVAYNPGTFPIQDALANTSVLLDETSVTNSIDISNGLIHVGTNPVSSTLVGSKLYVNNSSSNNVTVIDTNTDSVVATIPVGSTPSFSVFFSNKLYVVNGQSNNVSVINTNTDTFIKNISVGSGPSYITRFGSNIYVLNHAAATVSVIDAITDLFVKNIAVGPNAYYSTQAGPKLYVSNGGNNTVSVIDSTTNQFVKNIAVGNSVYTATQVGNKLYTNNSNGANVSVINMADDTFVKNIAVGTTPDFSTAVGSKLYVNNFGTSTVSVINTNTDSVIATIQVGRKPYTSTRVGSKLYVNLLQEGFISVIDTDTDTVIKNITTPSSNLRTTLVGSKLYQPRGVYAIDTLKDVRFNFVSPKLLSITSSNANGRYVSSQTINITANFNKNLGVLSKMRLTLNTGAVVDLNVISGATLSGNYAISSGDKSPDLSVTSISSDGNFTHVLDTSTYPNIQESFPVPNSPELTGDTYKNLGDLKDIVIGDQNYTKINVGTNPYQFATVGSTIYVANQGSDNVSVVNTLTNTTITTIPVGSQPYGVAYNSTSKEVYVANLKGDSVSVIDVDPAHVGTTTYNTVTNTVSVGIEPYYVASLGAKIYVTNNLSDTVSVIDTASHTVLATIPVGEAPRGIKAVGTEIYVANFGSTYSGTSQGSVSVIDSTNDSVIDVINVGSGPRGVAVNGSEVYVANFNDGTVSVIDTDSKTVTNTVVVGNKPRGMLSLGGNIYVENFADGTVSVIATSTHSVTNTINVGNTPAGMTAVGENVYISRFTDGVLSILDTINNTLKVIVESNSSSNNGSSAPQGGGSSSLYTSPDYVSHVVVVTNATSTFKFMQNIKMGEKKVDVKQLQSFLNTHGFPVSKKGAGALGLETNYFGILTKWAIQAFQISNNIKPVSGFFGPLTRAKVNEILQKDQSNKKNNK